MRREPELDIFAALYFPRSRLTLGPPRRRYAWECLRAPGDRFHVDVSDAAELSRVTKSMRLCARYQHLRHGRLIKIQRGHLRVIATLLRMERPKRI
jgi:hypothetical protein